MLLVLPPAPLSPPAGGVGGAGGGAAGITDGAVAALAGLGLVAYDARQLVLRGVPFVVGADDLERARAVALELRRVGVEAWVVDEDLARRVPPVETARSFRVFLEGIEVTTRGASVLGGPATHAVRYPDVELLVAGKSIHSTTTETVKVTKKLALNPVKMMRPGKTETETSHDESDERFFLLLARAPDVLLRFDEHGLDYGGLGEARQSFARANFQALLQLLQARAPAAPVDGRLEKLASRVSGAPIPTATSSGRVALTRKTERTFGENNEDAVLGAARLLCLAARLRG